MSEHNERPIIFSGEMVRAILDGRKTTTRRTQGLNDVNSNPDIWEFVKMSDLDYMTKKEARGKYGAYFKTDRLEDRTIHICPVVVPYGRPGDLLYVRESFSYITKAKNEHYDKVRPDGCPVEMLYRANAVQEGWEREVTWSPSIHMPKWAARTWLEVTAVRVERLQEITYAGAIAEGAETEDYLNFREWAESVAPPGSHIENVRDHFGHLWDKINGKRGYPFESNPLVWVVEFRVATRPDQPPPIPL